MSLSLGFSSVHTPLASPLDSCHASSLLPRGRMFGSGPWAQHQRLSQNLLGPPLMRFLCEKRILVTCFGFFIWRTANCTNLNRKTSPPVGTAVVGYLLSQPALHPGLRTGPGPCQAHPQHAVTQEQGPVGDRSQAQLLGQRAAAEIPQRPGSGVWFGSFLKDQL